MESYSLTLIERNSDVIPGAFVTISAASLFPQSGRSPLQLDGIFRTWPLKFDPPIDRSTDIKNTTSLDTRIPFVCHIRTKRQKYTFVHRGGSLITTPGTRETREGARAEEQTGKQRVRMNKEEKGEFIDVGKAAFKIIDPQSDSSITRVHPCTLLCNPDDFHQS